VVIPGINSLFTFIGTGLNYYANKGKTKVWVINNGKIGILKEMAETEFEAISFYSAKEGVAKIDDYCKN